MAVVVDNTGQSNGSAAGVSSLDITSFAVGAGANRLLVVGVSWYSATDRTVTLASSTWNGSQTFSQWDTTSTAEAPGVRRVILLYLINPANATGTIHIVFSGTVTEVVIGATSWTGVHQTTPLGTAVKNQGTGNSSTLSISSATNNAVHDMFSSDATTTATATPGQTQRWRQVAAANTTEGGGQSAAGAASVSMGWTTFNGGNSNNFAHIGADIQAVAAAANIPGWDSPTAGPSFAI